MRNAIRHLLTGLDNSSLIRSPSPYSSCTRLCGFSWIGIVSTGTLWPHWPLYL